MHLGHINRYIPKEKIIAVQCAERRQLVQDQAGGPQLYWAVHDPAGPENGLTFEGSFTTSQQRLAPGGKLITNNKQGH